MIIREITENDAKQLSVLANYVWCNTYCRDGIRDIEAQYVTDEFNTEKFLNIAVISSKTCIVAENFGKIVGFCILNFRSRYKNNSAFGEEIEKLYVFPELQRKGIGGSLLQSVYQNYGANKWLTTWVHNYSAINFYRKNNFQIIGTAEFNLFGEIHQNHVFHHK